MFSLPGMRVLDPWNLCSPCFGMGVQDGLESAFRILRNTQVLPALLTQVPGEVDQVSGDGAYDTRACYESIAKRGATDDSPCSLEALQGVKQHFG